MQKQKLNKAQILVIEPDRDTYFRMVERLSGSLESHNVFCVRSWSEAKIYAKAVYQDIILLGTRNNETSTEIRQAIDLIASSCPEAKFVLFLAQEVNPRDGRVKAIASKPEIYSVIRAIRFLLSPTETLAP